MTNVQDPAFWRRFSLAVHRDDEQQTQKQAELSSYDSTRLPSLQNTQSWLAREKQKKRRRSCICWAFWICFLALIATVVVVVLCLRANGMLGGTKSGGSGGNVMDAGDGGTSSKGGDGP